MKLWRATYRDLIEGNCLAWSSSKKGAPRLVGNVFQQRETAAGRANTHSRARRRADRTRSAGELAYNAFQPG